MDKKLSQDLMTVPLTQLLEFTEISHTYLPASIGEVVASIIFLKSKNNFFKISLSKMSNNNAVKLHSQVLW